MDVRVGLWRRLSTEELMLLSCGAGEDSWKSLDCKEIQPVHSKGDQPWVFFGGMMLNLKLQYCGHLFQRVDSLEKTLMLGGIGAGGEGDDRGWDGWMASPTPRVHPNSCPLTISSSVIPFSSCHLSQHQSLFQWVNSLHEVAKLLEFQL